MKFKKVDITLEGNNKKIEATYEDGSQVSFIVGQDDITSEIDDVLRDIYIQYEIFIPTK